MLTLRDGPPSRYGLLANMPLGAVGVWNEYEPTEIPLGDLINELLPKLLSDGIQPSVFRTPEGDAVLPAIPQLLADLENEMSRYE